MSVKKIILFVLIILTATAATSCYDSREVNSESLITAVSLDWKDDQYTFHVELPNIALGQGSQLGGAGGEKEYQVVSGSGETLPEARNSLDYKMDKPIFLGTVRILILTENAAKHGIDEYMYRQQSDIQYRKAVFVVTTRSEPEELLSSKPENNLSVGFSIEDTLFTLRDAGHKIGKSSSDVLEHLASKTCFVLPNFDLKNGNIACTGYTVIHDGKYKGFIEKKEAKGLIWISGDNVKWIYVVPHKDYDVTIEVTLKKRKIKPVYKDEKLTLNLEFSFDSEIRYISKNVSFKDDDNYTVNEALKKQILQDLSDAIIQSKQMGCEYFGFIEFFRIRYPDILKKIDWEQTYLNSKINISVDSSLKAGGLANFESQGRQPEEN